MTSSTAGAGTVEPESSGPAHFQVYVDVGRPRAQWRLLSGNHRELGRSVTAIRDVEDARHDIAQVVGRLAGADLVVRPVAGRRWEWHLVDPAGTLAVSGHAFDRRLRCELAAGRFLEWAPTAPVADHVIASGARRGVRVGRPRSSTS